MRHHLLDLSVDPAIRAISGTVTHRVAATQELAQVVLDLADELIVSSVLVDGQPAVFAHANDSLVVELSPQLPEGEEASIAVTYSGVPPETGFGSFVQDEH